MENQSFFMVFVEGGKAPSCRHATFEGAEIEAKRLVKMLHKKAYVLCSLKSIELTEFVEKDMRPQILKPPF